MNNRLIENNVAMTKKFTITKFDCSTERSLWNVKNKHLAKITRVPMNFICPCPLFDLLKAWKVLFELKCGNLKSTQNWKNFLFNKKFGNCLYFFTCIWPDYIAHDMTKEFWKNSFFENMTWFHSRLSKLTWVKYPRNYAWSDMTFFIFTNIDALREIVLIECILYPKENFCFNELIFQ